jgi:hypothetical protein
VLGLLFGGMSVRYHVTRVCQVSVQTLIDTAC